MMMPTKRPRRDRDMGGEIPDWTRRSVARDARTARTHMGRALAAGDCDTAHRERADAVTAIMSASYWVGSYARPVTQLFARLRRVNEHVGRLCRWR